MRRLSSRDILETASGLKSESGENVEYDRALVELVSSLIGYSTKLTCEKLGVGYGVLYTYSLDNQG